MYSHSVVVFSWLPLDADNVSRLTFFLLQRYDCSVRVILVTLLRLHLGISNVPGIGSRIVIARGFLYQVKYKTSGKFPSE